jgi:hypothetical protein
VKDRSGDNRTRQCQGLIDFHRALNLPATAQEIVMRRTANRPADPA